MPASATSMSCYFLKVKKLVISKLFGSALIELCFRVMAEFVCGAQYRRWKIAIFGLFFWQMARPSTTLFLIEAMGHENSLL
jgi:hypothetical protein